MDNGLYRLAKMYTAGGDITKQWFVYYYERNTVADKFKRVRLYGSINQHKIKKDRIQLLRLLRDVCNDCLKKGMLFDSSTTFEETAVDGRYLNCLAAMRQVVEDKTGLRKKTKQGNSSIVNLFEKFCKQHSLNRLPITEIKGLHLLAYQKQMIAAGLAAKTINNRMSLLKTIFTRLIKLEIIQKNPCSLVDNLKQKESNFYEPYTPEEMAKIADCLKQQNPGLFLVWLHIYYCFLRPATILKLQAKHYNFALKQINIDADIHKNKKDATKQIMQPLWEYLIKYEVDKLPPETYVFSINLLPGKEPGINNAAGKQWKKIIMKGLGINKKLYAAKHTGGIDYLAQNSGVEDVSWLQQQMSHQSLSETQTYIKKRQIKMLDESKAVIKRI